MPGQDLHRLIHPPFFSPPPPPRDLTKIFEYLTVFPKFYGKITKHSQMGLGWGWRGGVAKGGEGDEGDAGCLAENRGGESGEGI